MWGELLEGLGVGALIGLLAMAAHTLLGLPMLQWLALVGGGALLVALQLALVRRRFRAARAARPPAASRERRRRLRGRNSFTHELTHNWTGLSDPPADKHMPAATHPHDISEPPAP